ncbi:hypothetical protein CDAR_596381 [Caerostris darwini]|uniref:Uncharacterized protein n=1 Tax=Caerostris darwini TaxID=1538125 RepID=A0AAV4TZF1_9ARAC|nr:hypothetical protein CDAR_596381 [Caerostris darwini]
MRRGYSFPVARILGVGPSCSSCHGTSKKKKEYEISESSQMPELPPGTAKRRKARQNKFEDPRPNPFQKFRVANFLCHFSRAKYTESGFYNLKANKACERSEEKRGATFLQNARSPSQAQMSGLSRGNQQKKKECQNKFEDPHRNPFQNFRVANFFVTLLTLKYAEGWILHFKDEQTSKGFCGFINHF